MSKRKMTRARRIKIAKLQKVIKKSEDVTIGYSLNDVIQNYSDEMLNFMMKRYNII